VTAAVIRLLHPANREFVKSLILKNLNLDPEKEDVDCHCGFKTKASSLNGIVISSVEIVYNPIEKRKKQKQSEDNFGQQLKELAQLVRFILYQSHFNVICYDEKKFKMSYQLYSWIRGSVLPLWFC